ncbi:hypothetical protein ACP4OV_007159 [Aristida adscensionis]
MIDPTRCVMGNVCGGVERVTSVRLRGGAVELSIDRTGARASREGEAKVTYVQLSKPAMAQTGGGGEHRIDMPEAHGGGGVDTPEKQLNCFVRAVALIQRLGNALGTLAFTWATVVLLGGYPAVLLLYDLCFATIIVFLEAARMFSRNNRLDYQMFFHTRGALRPLGWNGLIITVCLSSVMNYMVVMALQDKAVSSYITISIMLILTAAVGQFMCTRAIKPLANKQLRRAASLCGPVVAILLIAPSMHVRDHHGHLMVDITFRNNLAKWIVFHLLLLVVLLLTISRLRFQRIVRFVDRTLGDKKVFWRRLILNFCMFVALVMMVFMYDNPIYQRIMISYQIYAILAVSFGNLQIPAAATRVLLSLLRLLAEDYCCDDPTNSAKKNLVPSLIIFYGMVLGQGILYIVACMLEIFSFIPRRSLVHQGGFRGQWSVESINFYYGYALEKCMERNVLASKKISLINFAMDSLNSGSQKMQLHGVRIMYSLMQREPMRTRLLSKLAISTKTMATLINMLGCSSPEDATTRLFAAKVTVELAKSLRAFTMPGTVQIISALLDIGNQQISRNPLLDTDYAQVNTTTQLSKLTILSNKRPGYTDVGNGFLNYAQFPRKRLADYDFLPALGISIIDNLASCDQDNCVEISRASGLIPKIIGFTSYCRSGTTYTSTEQKILMESSLKLLHRLTSINGEIGIVLRHKVSKHPFLLRNLAAILKQGRRRQELRKLAAGILRNLAIDDNTRQAIGRNRVVITSLMHAFLTQEGTLSADDDRLLRKVAGQALAMLAMDNVNNCLAMLRETGYEFIKELTSMIYADRYRCLAANLLRNMCLHARSELRELDLKELSYILRKVLERIMEVESAELETLIGLSSQICRLIPEDFAQQLENCHMKERFVKRLVDVLNANMEPSADCPRIRRVILEQAIHMMEHDSHYANCFDNCRMADAMSMVEETASEAENYRIFMGDVGLIESGKPLMSLVVRSRQLLAAVR